MERRCGQISHKDSKRKVVPKDNSNPDRHKFQHGKNEGGIAGAIAIVVVVFIGIAHAGGSGSKDNGVTPTPTPTVTTSDPGQKYVDGFAPGTPISVHLPGQPKGEMFPLQQALIAAAKKNHVPTSVESALLQQEDPSYNPDAVGKAGEIGLGQITQAAAHDVGQSRADLHNPIVNIDISTEYLRRQFDASGSWDNACYGYNAGPGNLKEKIREKNVIPTALAYEQSVMARAREADPNPPA